MKHSIMFFALLLAAFGAQAQQAISAAGATATTEAGSLSYTVGQPVAATAVGLNIGVQQTFVVTELHIDGVEPLAVSVYPNPTTSVVKVEAESATTLRYTLFSVNGNVLMQGTLGATAEVNLSSLPTGAYLLRLDSDSGRQSNYRIIKR